MHIFNSCGRIICVMAIVISFCFIQVHAGDNLNDKPCSKKCVSDIIKGCSDRELRTSQALSKLMDQLKDASNSNDPDKMKSALEDARKSLSDMKSDHDKSGDVLQKLHHRIEHLKEQIKVVRHEQRKAAGMLEDADMDDVIWAY